MMSVLYFAMAALVALWVIRRAWARWLLSRAKHP